MEFEITSANAIIGIFAGTIFGNCFPFPSHWWNKCRTPVGVMIAVGIGYMYYQGN